MVKASGGYTGSNKDHMYMPMPGSDDVSAAWLFHRNRPCPCDSCLKRDFANCLVRRLFQNDSGHVQVERKTGAAARKRTRGTALLAFSKLIKPGTKLAIRVHSDEGSSGNPHREEYYIGTIPATSPSVWRNTKTQIIGSNTVTKGTWVVRVRWLHYNPDVNAPSTMAGSRAYQFVVGEHEVVFPLTGVITTAHTHMQTLRFSRENSHYCLPATSHAAMLADQLSLLS
jgi:hypothetical protein